VYFPAHFQEKLRISCKTRWWSTYLTALVGVGLVGDEFGGGSAAAAHAAHGRARRVKVCYSITCDPHGRGYS
jgi:hypothetical protein